MKTLLLSLLFCLPMVAQTGFKMEGKDVIWQGVFSTETANIVAVLEKEPNLKINGFMDNMYKGMGIDVENTCNGGTGLMKNNLNFDYVILIDPSGYVVKVRNIKILEKYGPMQARTVANRCEKYFIAGNKLSDQPNASANMACMDRFFTSLFSTGEVETPSTVLTSN